MSLTQLGRRLDNLESRPDQNSKVVIIATFGAEDADGKFSYGFGDRILLRTEAGQEFLIERDGMTIDEIADRVNKAYPYGTKYLLDPNCAIKRPTLQGVGI